VSGETAKGEMEVEDPSTSAAALQRIPCADEINALKRKALELRIDTLEMLAKPNSGHVKASFSEMDILVALYHGGVLHHDAANPLLEDRDRFILSKGHGAPGLYSVLADRGYFPKERLGTLRQIGGLSGHTLYGNAPGIEATTGALGQGIAVALGRADYAKRFGKPWMVYCMIGDGENQEGVVSGEVAWAAPSLGLGNLVVIRDRNGLQNDTYTSAYVKHDAVPEALRSYGWQVIKLADGHEYGELLTILRGVKEETSHRTQPVFIDAPTIGGKDGYHLRSAEGEFTFDRECADPANSFSIENNPTFHGALPNKKIVQDMIAHMRMRLDHGVY